MTKQMTIAAGVLLAGSALRAQTVSGNGAVFQYVVNGVEGAAGMKVLDVQGINAGAVTGKPFSATEEHRTVQVLADGTRIENSTSSKFFRDDQGRTRTERQDGTTIIHDPVQGVSSETNANKTRSLRRNMFYTVRPDENGGIVTLAAPTTDGPVSPAKVQKMKAEMEVRALDKARVAGLAPPDVLIAANPAALKEAVAKGQQVNEENLGFQSINGVTAQGTRTTTTIPTGQIGNNRPITIVSERWVSPDLQILVKSTNSDPRFGETTYDLTNIQQGAQDPSLFQIPAEVRQQP
ncbi:MAG TPA: hypothetical protein VHB50_02395 [Bryobacteraceae bacterium]|nr:hypothetical protein [Bryobacteraceae bacterium]